MGCFSSDKPEMPTVSAPKYKTAQEIYAEAIPFAKENYPLAYGAREGALADLLKGTSYYESFQPTSFEEALANQYFANAYPEIERATKHTASLTGMESLVPELLGKRTSELGVSIGEILANLANTRAQSSLSSRLSIDPYSVTGPYANVDLSQSNAQAEADYQAALANAQAEYQNAVAEANQKAAGISSIGSVLGGVGGFMVGGPAGAAIGSSLGGTASSLFGGGTTPINFSDALALSQIYPAGKTVSTTGGIIGSGMTDWENEMLKSLGKAKSVGLFN